MAAPNSRLVPLPNACAELDLGRTKLHELLNDGKLTRVRIGARSFVTRESLDAFVDSLIASR
jgi:hypothetical protein